MVFDEHTINHWQNQNNNSKYVTWAAFRDDFRTVWDEDWHKYESKGNGEGANWVVNPRFLEFLLECSISEVSAPIALIDDCEDGIYRAD